MSSHITLSASAEDRKARLAKLRNLKRKKPADEPAEPEADAQSSRALSGARKNDEREGEEKGKGEGEINSAAQDVSRVHLSGRNYDPETRGPKLGFDAPPSLADDKPTLEQQAAGLEARVKQQAVADAADDKGIDLFKLQPKKPNWDLKRNLERKMDVLNVRTDNAIARLVKDRISAAQQKAKTGSAAAAAAQKSFDGDGDGVDADAVVGMDGATLVESVRVREQEDEEQERREREEEEAEEEAALVA